MNTYNIKYTIWIQIKMTNQWLSQNNNMLLHSTINKKLKI